MKRMAEKVALAAFVCISLIFVLICILTYFNLIPLGNGIVLEVDWALLIILLVIGVLWVFIAIYLLYVNFSQRMALKYIMLYSDIHSSTKATSKVIKQLAVKESRQLHGVRIKKIHITANEHLGLNMRLIVEVANDDVAFSIDTLRYLLTDKYKEVLGLEFAAMDFQIKKIKSNYTPDIGKAQAKAELLGNKRSKCSVAVSHIEGSEDEVGEISGGIATPSTTEQQDDDQPQQQNDTPSQQSTQQSDNDQNTDTAQEDFEQPESIEIDQETQQRLNEQKQSEFEKKQKTFTAKPMYGTPESPLTDDIVVEIDDDENQESENAQLAEKEPETENTQKVETSSTKKPRKTTKKK